MDSMQHAPVHRPLRILVRPESTRLVRLGLQGCSCSSVLYSTVHLRLDGICGFELFQDLYCGIPDTGIHVHHEEEDHVSDCNW